MHNECLMKNRSGMSGGAYVHNARVAPVLLGVVVHNNLLLHCCHMQGFL